MAGKTGTAQVNYGGGKGDGMYYASSFVGYFPADNPQYSCIVIIHKPSRSKGYYGADVSGPVFKRIAQKIFTDVPSTNQIKNLDVKIAKQEKLYASYYDKVAKIKETVPNVIGMSGMDAVALFGNMGAKVQVIGSGKVKKQSIPPGKSLHKDQTVILELF
jgi:cell division protein FtsI (penicillin-binding protein 3)